MKSLVLLGGGLDSLAVLEYALRRGDTVTCLRFSCFTPRSDRATQEIAQFYHVPLLVRDLTSLGEGYWKSLQDVGNYVPDRNLVFLTLASALGKSLGQEEVLYGAIKSSTWHYDTKPEFVKRVNAILDLDRWAPMVVDAPMIEESKEEIIKLLVNWDSPIHLTYSCYREQEIVCGKCLACRARADAFAAAGVKDPSLSLEGVG